ncbi:MAG: tyrosine-type recombinase/integrase [Acidobacteriota bacterium]
MKAAEEEHRRGNFTAPTRTTVGEWLDQWIETYAHVRVRQNTLDGYKVVIKAHLKPSIGNLLIKELQPQQVQMMLNDKLKSGRKKDKGPLSPRMVAYIYSVLHMALEQAVKNQMIPRNVCDSVDKPKQDKTEFEPWTTEQTNHFLRSVQKSRLFPLYITVWGTGLRRSELLGLKWEDIDLKKGNLTVKRTWVNIKGGQKFGEPKTKKSRRVIPLPGPVVAELKTWRKRQSKEALAFPGEYNPLNMVFTTEAGEPYKPDYITRSFKNDLEEAKLPEIRFHDLRHGHATMLLELGEDLKVISDRLGHSTITLTADTYSHVREKLQRSASDKLATTLNLKS